MSETGRGPQSGAAGRDQGSKSPRTGLSWAKLVPIALFGALALIFLVQLIRGGHTSDVPSPLIGAAVPVFDLAPLEGLVAAGEPVPGFSNEVFLGQVSVVNVWASWCGPCRDEHPVIEELATDDRIQVLGINHTDQPQNALAFLNQFGNPYDAVGVDPRARTSIDWGVYGVPETFFVDRTGTIRFKIIGPISEARLASQVIPLIEELLAEPAPAPQAAAL